MGPDAPKLLDDLIHAATLLAQFVAGKSFEEYRTDLTMRSAVVRQLQLLGQALERLYQKDPATAEQLPWGRRLMNLGNILRHDDVIEEPVIWDVVQIYVPGLRQIAAEILNSFEEERPPEI